MILCCLAFIITSLSACNSEAVVIADHDKYDLIKKGKDYYLVLDESIIKSYEAMHSDPKVCIDYIFESITFGSIEELIDTLKNGKLTDSQLLNVCAYQKSSDGTKICDISDMQVPVLPKEFEWQSGSWNGKTYSFDFESSTGESGTWVYRCKEDYDRLYERNYLNYFDNELITLEKVVNNRDKTEYYYSSSTAESKLVRYTVKKWGTTLIVDEHYLLGIKHHLLEDSQVSDSIPSKVKIYGRKSNHYFMIDLYTLKEPPTEEWIKSFGIKDYE